MPANILYICLLSLLLVWSKLLFRSMQNILPITFLMLFSFAVFGQESYPIKVNKKWGLINSDGQVIVDPIYDAIGEFKQFGYAVMQRQGNVGMLNSFGEEIILPEYQDIKVLDSMMIGVMQDNNWKVINLDGRVILDRNYERIQVWKGGFLGYMIDGKWGIVNHKGKHISKPQFDGVLLKDNKYFHTQIDDLVGLMDKEGNMILDAVAEKIEVFNDRLFFYQNNNEWGAVNQLGEKLIDQRYERYRIVSDSFLVLDNAKSKDLYSISSERILLKSDYDAFYPFSDQYLLIKKNRRLGLINMEGQKVLDLRYDEIQAFAENGFRAKLQDKWGVVAAGDSLVIPFEYDFLAPLKNKNCLVKNNSRFGVLSFRGELVVPIEFDRIEMMDDQAQAYKKEVFSVFYFDEDGMSSGERNFKKRYTINIGKNRNLRPSITRLLGSESDYTLENFEWFYSSQEDKWGLRKLEDGSIKIKPSFHTINVQKELGFTIVGLEKMSRGIYERTSFRFEMVYGVVNNEVGLLVSELNLLDIRMNDYMEGFKVARVIFTNGKHGLMSREPVGLMVKKDYAYIGDFREGIARMSTKGKLSGSLKSGQYGLGLLTSYLNRMIAPSIMLDYTLYDREFENEAQLICEECKWGYLDTLGEIKVQPQFSFARTFINDVGIVENDNKWGAVDKTDRMVLPTIYDGVHFLDNTNNKILRVYNNQQKYGLIDTLGQVTVNLHYDKIGAFNEGRLAVKRNGFWGFVDKNGREIVPCRFQMVKNFYNGMAAVKISNKWGVIDRQGDILINFKYTRLGNFKEGLAWAYTPKGVCFINADNEEVIPARYSKAYDFQNGLARVVINGKYGLINKDGEYVVRPRYTFIESFDQNGLAIVRFGQSRIRYGVINTSGRLITNHNYKQIRPFKEGFAAVKHKGKYGFINTKGNLVISAKYSKVSDFNEERASVQRAGLCGYIDTQGDEVVELEFSKCLDFEDGKAVVYKGYRRGGVIDLNGNFIIEPSINRLFRFSDGRGLVRDSSYQFYYISAESNNVHSGMYQKAGAFQHGVAVVQSMDNGHWGIINQRGIEIISPKYDKIENFKDGYARVRIHQLSGLSNLEGELIVKPDYEYISYAGDGVFRVEQGDKIGYFDADGKWIWEIKE